MKIIHTADIHLGSKYESTLKAIKEDRKSEVLNTFIRLVKYAKDNDVKIILLAGDVFDNDSPAKKDHDNFYSLIEKNPEIKFMYLRGNHDLQENYDNKYPNLYTFDSNWKSYEFDDIRITGIEMNVENADSMYQTLNIDNEKINIVMLHAEVANQSGMNKVVINKLKNKNIDYLALGHIHKASNGPIDEQGVYVNPGCLEGRGFDETGKKGFILLDTSSMDYSFIPFCQREIKRYEIDITGTNNLIEILNKIDEKLNTEEKNIINVQLKGELDYEVEFDINDIITQYKDKYYFFSADDKTKRKIDYDKFKNDTSFKGEFVRQVYQNNELSDDEKQEVIRLGLQSLEFGGVAL